MPILGVAEWAPDEPDLSDYTNIATNVIPLTPQSYGPMRAQVPYSTNTIDDICLGMGSAEDIDNDHFVFAGTANKLWLLTVGSGRTWIDCTPVGKLPTTGNWYFAQYKNLMLATDYVNSISFYDMDGVATTFATLSATAPKATYLAVAKGFVIAANTNDPVGGINPTRLWWSGINDPTNWPVPGSALAQEVMSDYNDMPGPMGDIMGLAPNLAGCDCAVFFERGVFRMIFAGPPAVFDFYPASSVKGTPAPNSIVPLGNMVYFLGEDGFYAFDGNQAAPIGANKIDRWFFDHLDQRFFRQIVGAPDIANKAICWAFRSTSAPVFETMGTESLVDITTESGDPIGIFPLNVPDTMLIYRWDIQKWSVANYSQQWIARLPVVSTLGTLSPNTDLQAGQLQLASIDSERNLSFFTGSNLSAQVGTKVSQLTPGARTFVNSTRPLVDYVDPTTVTVALSAKNTYQATEVFGPEQGIDISGQCSQRSEGRYHRGRITISGAAVWKTLAGLDITGQKASLR